MGSSARETGAVARRWVLTGIVTALLLVGAVVAASDPSWAAVQLAEKPGTTFSALTVILHGGAGAWSVVAHGGADAGCGSAPQSVIVDLGQFCAGSGGGA